MCSTNKMSLRRIKSWWSHLPPRLILFIWGYFAVIATYLGTLPLLYRFQNIYYEPKSFTNEYFYLFICLVEILAYFIFHVIFVVGLHKKSLRMLGVYKDYLIISMFLEGIAPALIIPLAMIKLYEVNKYYVLDHKTTITYWLVLPLAAVLAVIGVLWKYYILVCVRSLISTLNGDNKVGCLPEQNIRNPDVIVYDNRNIRVTDDNVESVENSDIIVHDDTNNKSKNDNTQLVENCDVIVNDNTNTRSKNNDNILPIESSDIIIHDDTSNISKNDNIQLVENSDIILHDNTNTRSKDDNIQPVESSDIIILDDTNIRITQLKKKKKINT